MSLVKTIKLTKNEKWARMLGLFCDEECNMRKHFKICCSFCRIRGICHWNCKGRWETCGIPRK